MIVHSSAVLAVIGKEPGYERIVHAFAASGDDFPQTDLQLVDLNNGAGEHSPRQ